MMEPMSTDEGSGSGRRTWLTAGLMLPTAIVFVLGGGKLGMLMGVGTAAAIIVYAARSKFDGPLEVAEPAPGTPGGVLVVALDQIDSPAAAEAIGSIAARAGRGGGDGIRLLAPARSRRLDRWTSDLADAQFESQRVLAVSVASLAAAGLEAEGRVGDGDPFQAVEDNLRTFAASEVVIVARPDGRKPAISALERRLDRPVHRIDAGAEATPAGIAAPGSGRPAGDPS